MKQETLEEAAFNYSKNKVNKNKSLLDFTKGAKWQAGKMYSEEDMKISWTNGNNYHRGSLIDASQFTFEKTIEQFKKKLL